MRHVGVVVDDLAAATEFCVEPAERISRSAHPRSTP
jgi:hypothetical protein